MVVIHKFINYLTPIIVNQLIYFSSILDDARHIFIKYQNQPLKCIIYFIFHHKNIILLSTFNILFKKISYYIYDHKFRFTKLIKIWYLLAYIILFLILFMFFGNTYIILIILYILRNFICVYIIQKIVYKFRKKKKYKYKHYKNKVIDKITYL